MTDIVAFLTARLDEDEVWALEASRVRGHLAEGGVHWQWVHGPNWDPVTPDPTRGNYLTADDGEYFCGSLISVEEFPWSRDDLGSSPQVVNGELRMQDVHAAAAGHIVRHHPARVLRAVAGTRALLRDAKAVPSTSMRRALRCAAAAYDEHPDYDPAWRVE